MINFGWKKQALFISFSFRLSPMLGWKFLMDGPSSGARPDSFKAWIECGQSTVSVGIVVLFGAFPVLERNMVIAIGVALLVITGLTWVMQWRVAPPLGAFCFSCIALSLLGLPSQLWFAIGLVVYAGFLRFGPHRGKSRWLTSGCLTREVVILMAVSVLSSAVALNIWFFVARPDIRDIIERFLPDWPLLLIVLGGLAFSMLNAVVEELAYRGVLMDALDKTIGVGVLSLFGQAAAFGVLHIHGFPRGRTGVALAFIFGVLMGLVRRRSGGFIAPWAAHVAADIVIVTIVVAYARA